MSAIRHVSFLFAVNFLTLLISVEGGETYVDFVVSNDTQFGYSKHNGPHTWGENFPTCGSGVRQSPIKINQRDCLNIQLPSLSWYDLGTPRELELRNTWHSAEVQFKNLENRPILSGGPLKGNYMLSQVHFHWGRRKKGSEHALDGHFYAMEVHMVHYNMEFGSDIERASKQPSGLAVIAYFLESSHAENPSLAELVDSLDSVLDGNSTMPLSTSAMDWLWQDLDPSTYFTYEGSLTTPPCSEDVTWIVLKQCGRIGISQVSQFRRLRTHDGLMVQNQRPTQPLNGRQIICHNGNDVFFPGDYY